MNKTLLMSILFAMIVMLGPNSSCQSLQSAEKKHAAVVELKRIRSKEITFCCLSHDGKVLAYADVVRPAGANARSDIVIIDVASGKEISRGSAEPGFVYGGVFSPDGKLLAVGTTNGNAYLWDIRKGAKHLVLSQLSHPDKQVSGMPLAFSGDGKLIAGYFWAGNASFGSLVVWETGTGKDRLFLYDPSYPVEATSGDKFSIKLGKRPVLVSGAATFADDGSPFLFVDTGDTVQCDVIGGKALRWAKVGGGSWPTRKYRFRTTPSGQILVLPKYREESPLAFVSYDDGTVALVAIDPSGYTNKYPMPNGKERELWRSRDFGNTTYATCSWSADGKILVARGIDPATAKAKSPSSMLLIWDVSKLRADAGSAALKTKVPSPSELEEYWGYLGEEYNAFPQKAMLLLQRFPNQAVPFLSKRLGKPVDADSACHVINELDDRDFATRMKAMKVLEQMGSAVGPFLENALKGKISQERRRRVDQLLAQFRATAPSDELRHLRIIDVLEHINTPAARDLLQTIAGGGYGLPYAKAAKTALTR